jgi:hypothetical protein
MDAIVARDLSDSAHDFLRVVWPQAKAWCGDGVLRPVEAVGDDDDFNKQFDMLAGIDAWQIVDGEGIRGISSRIQWPKEMKHEGEISWPGQSDGLDCWWESFTIRKKRSSGAPTEWGKRIHALENRSKGFINPHLIIHAYVKRPRREGELLYACMCRSDDLFRLATDEMKGKVWFLQTNPSDGNEFAVFPVEWLENLGVRVRKYRKRSNAFQSEQKRHVGG